MGILNRNIKINRTYLLLFLVVNFMIIGLYYTYSIFVVKQLKEDVALININIETIKININEEETNVIELEPFSKREVKVKLIKDNNVDTYYKLVHKVLPTGVMIYSEEEMSGLIKDEVLLTINVDNETDVLQKIELKVLENKTEIPENIVNYSNINNKANLDHSNASKPELLSNMIPVYYVANTTTQGNWFKADSKNDNYTNFWYDYDNFVWANAVTVSEETRKEYQEAEPGTMIEDKDINAFFVWIPSFKYYLINTNNTENYEKMINVIFTNDKNSGTVNCTGLKEICEDTKYGNLYNNLSTYYHPSFKDNNGFWIGKFSMKNSMNAMILPNEDVGYKGGSLNNSYIRQMQSYKNIYGFSESYNYNETTWNYEDKASDNGKEFDITPINSLEWGAVSILSSSQYGKTNNSMYKTNELKTFTRIYNNNSELGYTGGSSNYTNNSTSIFNSSTTRVYYNDLTDLTHKSNGITYPIGYKGAGASTTGTIYGVYDMSGGFKKTVMGVVLDQNNESELTMDSKYYTTYPYIEYNGELSNNSLSKYISSFKLGDGIKEHVKTFSKNGMWQDGKLVVSNTGILSRGGLGNEGSIFTTEVNTIDESTEWNSTYAIIKVK